MSYTITDYTNSKIGTTGITVDDYTINTDTLLDLVGKGNVDYSDSIFENFIYILSNFSGPYPPGTNFAESYKENKDWSPTITKSTSTVLTSLRTNLNGTFWFQTPELNICSNFISKLIDGYNDNPTDELKGILTGSYDPGNYFTNNSKYVYGQSLASGGTLWIYTGENVSNTVSPELTNIDGNLYASYDPSLLGWEAYSTISVSKEAPANRFALWLNSNDNNFYYYNNSTLQWARVGTPSSIEPTADNTGITVSDGTLWIKDGQLWMKNTTLTNSQSSYPPKYQNETDSSVINDGWVLIGPTSPKPDNQVKGTNNGFNGTDTRYAVLIDDQNEHHDNLLIFDSGLLISIISSDNFTINSTTPILGNDIITPSIEGLKVFAGINLVGDTYFNGQITDGGIDYATKQYVDQVVSGGSLGYAPVQQGGGTNMANTHIYIGQSSVNGDLLAQAGSQQLGSIAFKTWTNTNFLSLTNGGTVQGPVSLNGGSTTVTVDTSDNSTNIATTAFVNNLTNGIIKSNPSSGDLKIINIIKNDTGEVVFTDQNNNTDIIPTENFLKNNYLPLTGGEITGNLSVDGTIFGTCTQALYADIAENYLSDNEYDFGTIVKIGGKKEITICDKAKNYFGVISKKPGFILNSANEGLPVVMCGRTPVKIKGKIKKGDKIVFYKDGIARKAKFYEKNYIGTALEDSNSKNIKLIECFVKV